MSSSSHGPRVAWLLCVVLAACRAHPGADVGALAAAPWDTVVARARGSTVVWRMWRGDPSINAYVDGWVAARLLERYSLRLMAVQGQGAEIVNQLVTEREARARGSADLVWINGEAFGNLRKESLLGGPWAGRLPNAAWIDSTSPIIARDFEQDPSGYESPWGTVQFALIYDSARTPDPPHTLDELRRWILAHPGRFTYDQSFAGTTLLKMMLYAAAGGVERLQGGFDEGRYATARDSVFRWLEGVRPALWRQGETYPQSVTDLHRLFANGEVDFSMSNNENDVITKIRQGVLPGTSRPLLLREGTIANAHYLGIPFNAPNPAGAMVVADFLLSPEAQLEKARPAVWADGTVLSVGRLPVVWAARFADLERDPGALPRDSLRRYARPEVNPTYHERLSADWRVRIREAHP